MQPGRARTSGLGVPLLPLARWVGRVAPVCPTHGVLVLSCPSAALRVRGVPGLLAPVHRCARVVCCVVFAVFWATWLLFTGAPARSGVLRVRRPGPLGSRSPVCLLGALCCVSGRPRPLGSCSPVRLLRVLLCVCGVLGHLAPVHRCACSVSCFDVQCPGPLGSCSPVCPRGSLRCVCGVLGHLAPDHRCARSVCCVACAVSWAPWPLFTGVPAGCAAFRVRCPGPLGSCSPVRPLNVSLCVRGVLGHLAPVHRCACHVFCFVCAVSWATWFLFTGVPAWCAVLCLRCPGPLGSCSPVCQAVVSRPFVALGARACLMSWPSWRLFTGVRAVCGARCPVVSLFLPPYFFFEMEKKERTGLWRVSSVFWRRSRPRGAARAS